MLTGAQYEQSLDDGRRTYFEGERVEDLVGHPILGQTVAFTAKAYDRYYDPAPDAVSPLLAVPGSADDLRALIPLLHDAGMMAHVTSTSIQLAVASQYHRPLRVPRPVASWVAWYSSWAVVSARDWALDATESLITM